LKKIHLIGTRTRDLPVCSIVPQPTTLPRHIMVKILASYSESPELDSQYIIRSSLTDVLMVFLSRSRQVINSFFNGTTALYSALASSSVS
jgi:hypothetical protein